MEFLEKRSELGEVKAEPSFKLSDAQYNALAGAFQQDKEVRSQAEKLLQKKPKEKKKDDNRAERLLSSSTQQQYKPLGKIDLDSIGKKPSELKPAAPEARKEPQVKTAAVSQKPANNKTTQGSEATADKTVEKTETKKNTKASGSRQREQTQSEAGAYYGCQNNGCETSRNHRDISR